MNLQNLKVIELAKLISPSSAAYLELKKRNVLSGYYDPKKYSKCYNYYFTR